MKKRSFKTLLIISLAFNLAFIGFTSFRFIQIRRFSDRERIFNQIPQHFIEKFMQHRDQMGPIRAEIDEIRKEFMMELRKEDFNKEILLEKLNDFLGKQSEMERILGTHLIELREEMTPEQAEKFFSHFPGAQTGPHHEKRSPIDFRRFHEKGN